MTDEVDNLTWPDMSIETCFDCDGDSDPIDDLYYCASCGGRGWIYQQMIDSPYHSHFDIEKWDREAREKHGKPYWEEETE